MLSRIVPRRILPSRYAREEPPPQPDIMQTLADSMYLLDSASKYQAQDRDRASQSVEAAITQAEQVANGDDWEAARSLDRSGMKGAARQLRDRALRTDAAINDAKGNIDDAIGFLNKRKHVAEADLLRQRADRQRARLLLRDVMPAAQTRDENGVPLYNKDLLAERFFAAGLQPFLAEIYRGIDAAQIAAHSEYGRRLREAQDNADRGVFTQAPPIPFAVPTELMSGWEK